jgi:hypothetical protein
MAEGQNQPVESIRHREQVIALNVRERFKEHVSAWVIAPPLSS